MPVHDQKSFYRKLDTLLAGIELGERKDRSDLLFSVLRDLVESFGDELSITNGRIYEVKGEDLVLYQDLRSPVQAAKGFRISLDYEPVKLLSEHKCYIFDASTPGIDPDYERKILGGTSSAAIVVGPGHEYVLAFGLADGWEREQIEFSLNAIRNALNHKLETLETVANLEETRLIQRSLFPAEIPNFPGYEIAARSETPEVVGGDFYDFIPLDDEIIGIATGDASGHGLPAALLVRDVVTGLRMGVEKDMKITPTLRKLNQVIHRSTLSTKFVSVFYGELEDNGNLMYVNGGHIPPYLLLDRGTFRLDVGGSILGPLPEIKFKRGFAHIDKGGLLVAVSDGIIERANAAGDQFGDNALLDLLMKCRGATATETLETVFRAAKRFGLGRWEDDATVVVVRRLP